MDEDDDEAYEDALLENILRGDMTPAELGNGFLAIMNLKGWKGHGRYVRLARQLYGDPTRADYIRGMVTGNQDPQNPPGAGIRRRPAAR